MTHETNTSIGGTKNKLFKNSSNVQRNELFKRPKDFWNSNHLFQVIQATTHRLKIWLSRLHKPRSESEQKKVWLSRKPRGAASSFFKVALQRLTTEKPERPSKCWKQESFNVGWLGIGKTLCRIKPLRDWALDKVLKATSSANINFYVAFLVKFRRFNSIDDRYVDRGHL